MNFVSSLKRELHQAEMKRRIEARNQRQPTRYLVGRSKDYRSESENYGRGTSRVRRAA